MLDEIIVCETPPWYSCYGRIGAQVRVLIMGNRGKRVLHGALNIWRGAVLLLITNEWVQETHCRNRGQCQNWPRWDGTIWTAWLEACRN